MPYLQPTDSASPTAAPSPYYPKFIALPGRRGGDPIFDLGRTWWLDCERAGLIKLYRLKRRGNVRGAVRIPVVQAAELMERLNASSAAEAKGGAS